MQPVPALVAVALLWSVAVVTPGPNFLMTLRVAALHTRADGLRAVLGIAIGTTIWGLAGFFGIHALFLAAPFLYDAFRLLGGAYLMFFGARLLWNSLRRDAATEAVVPVRRAGAAAFRIGLATSLSNPKTALSVAGLFAATMPHHPSVALGLTAVALMVAISAGWYSAVTCLFSARWMAGALQNLRRHADRVAGAIFVGFGVTLVLER